MVSFLVQYLIRTGSDYVIKTNKNSKITNNIDLIDVEGLNLSGSYHYNIIYR